MCDRLAASADGPQRVLNLFAYTGGASVALAAAGHHVTHVDASRPAIGWAQRNGPWRLADDLPGLLAACRSLLGDAPAFVLLNLYDRTATDALAVDLLREAFPGAAESAITGDTVDLQAGRRRLTTGVCARFAPPA
jgi:hypothetical protein